MNILMRMESQGDNCFFHYRLPSERVNLCKNCRMLCFRKEPPEPILLLPKILCFHHKHFTEGGRHKRRNRSQRKSDFLKNRFPVTIAVTLNVYRYRIQRLLQIKYPRNVLKKLTLKSLPRPDSVLAMLIAVWYLKNGKIIFERRRQAWRKKRFSTNL